VYCAELQAASARSSRRQPLGAVAPCPTGTTFPCTSAATPRHFS
jgi:hypothetical protein